MTTLQEINEVLKLAGASELSESEIPAFEKGDCKIEMPSKSDGWEELPEKEVDNKGVEPKTEDKSETSSSFKEFKFDDGEEKCEDCGKKECDGEGECKKDKKPHGEMSKEEHKEFHKEHPEHKDDEKKEEIKEGVENKLNYQMDIDIWYNDTGAYGTPVDAKVYSEEEGPWEICKGKLFSNDSDEDIEQYIIDSCSNEAKQYVDNTPLKVNITKYFGDNKKEEESFMINESRATDELKVADTDKEVEADAENKKTKEFEKELKKYGKLKGDGSDKIGEGVETQPDMFNDKDTTYVDGVETLTFTEVIDAMNEIDPSIGYYNEIRDGNETILFFDMPKNPEAVKNAMKAKFGDKINFYMSKKLYAPEIKSFVIGFREVPEEVEEVCEAEGDVNQKGHYLATLYTNYDRMNERVEKRFNDLETAKKWIKMARAKLSRPNQSWDSSAVIFDDNVYKRTRVPYKIGIVEKILKNGDYVTVSEIIWGDPTERTTTIKFRNPEFRDYPENNMEENVSEGLDDKVKKIKDWTTNIFAGALIAALTAFGASRINNHYEPTTWIPEDEFMEQARIEEAKYRWLGFEDETNPEFQKYLDSYQLYNEKATRDFYHSKYDKLKNQDNVKESVEEDVEESVGGNNEEDVLTMNVPLFMRLLEYAKEDAKTDMDLHYVVENILTCMKNSDILTMDCYDNIVKVPESKNNEIEENQ